MPIDCSLRVTSWYFPLPLIFLSRYDLPQYGSRRKLISPSGLYDEYGEVVVDDDGSYYYSPQESDGEVNAGKQNAKGNAGEQIIQAGNRVRNIFTIFSKTENNEPTVTQLVGVTVENWLKE